MKRIEIAALLTIICCILITLVAQTFQNKEMIKLLSQFDYEEVDCQKP